MHFFTKQQLILGMGLLLPLLGQSQNNLVIVSPPTDTPGMANVLVGINAGNAAMTGQSNTVIGSYAGNNLSSGSRNTLYGSGAGRNATTDANDNVFVGTNTGSINRASGGTFVGSMAGYFNMTGANNTFLGNAAGSANNSGGSNTFVGFQAGAGNSSGANNTFVGTQTGGSSGDNNVMIGDGAGKSNVASGNIFIGSKAGSTNSTGSANTFLGYQTGYTSTGNANTFLGYQAGYSNRAGGYNVFLGYYAGHANTSGLGNLFVGQQAGASNTVGSYNLFMGNSSGQNTTSGEGNTAIGDGALLANKGGFNNTAIGRYSGNNGSPGDNNTFIGASASTGATPSGGPIYNSTAIGYNAQVTASNSLILGSGANVGIGNSSPSTKLHLTADQDNSSGLRLEKLTNASPASGGQTKFLTVDGSGNVILGSSGAGGRESSSEVLWQRSNGLVQSMPNEAVVIGQGVSNTPTGYKLYVEQGILTERVKVAVKNTSEWSDYVFTPAYQLPSLAEVEAQIQQTGHLPGVPSAAQMVEQGNDLHQTDAKLMAKIEELTLYAIQLEKSNQQQQAEINALKQQKVMNQQQQAKIDELEQLVKQILGKVK